MNKYLLAFLLGLTGVSVVHADAPGIHGMLLFGDKTSYGCHLPMYHQPHDYQVIFQFKLHDKAGGNTLTSYKLAKETTQTYFTIVPEPMDLTQVINGTIRLFQVSLFEGHFERGGRKIGPLTVEVDKVLFSKKLHATDPVSGLEDQYFIFGSKGEYFASHIVGGAPNLDALLSVGQPFRNFTQRCRSQVCADLPKKVIPDSELPLLLSSRFIGGGVPAMVPTLPRVGDSLGGLHGHTKIQKVIYAEEGDLSE